MCHNLSDRYKHLKVCKCYILIKKKKVLWSEEIRGISQQMYLNCW